MVYSRILDQRWNQLLTQRNFVRWPNATLARIWLDAVGLMQLDLKYANLSSRTNTDEEDIVLCPLYCQMCRLADRLIFIVCNMTLYHCYGCYKGVLVSSMKFVWSPRKVRRGHLIQRYDHSVFYIIGCQSCIVQHGSVNFNIQGSTIQMPHPNPHIHVQCTYPNIHTCTNPPFRIITFNIFGRPIFFQE